MTDGEDWYRKSESEALTAQHTALEHAISQDEVARRRLAFGRNVLQIAKRRSIWRLLLAQFSDFLVLVLIAAAVIAAFLGEPQDTIAIIGLRFQQMTPGAWSGIPGGFGLFSP